MRWHRLRTTNLRAKNFTMAAKKDFSHSTPHGDGPQTADDSHISNPGVHHEVSDVNTSGIYKFGLWMIVIIIGTAGLMLLMYNFLEDREIESDPAPSAMQRTQNEILPPEPRLQLAPGHEIHPLDEMAQMRAQEDAYLSSYGWMDKNSGTVRMPIDEAKRLLLAKGLPTASGATSFVDTTGVLRSDSTGMMGTTTTQQGSGNGALNYRRVTPSATSTGRTMEYRDK